MEIIFKSQTEDEQEFDFNGEKIINSGDVTIIKFDPSLPDPIGLVING